jgi:hypothetical protein
MTTITLPVDIAGPIAEEARRRGTTPERLAIDMLRRQFAPPVGLSSEQPPEPTLADFLDGYIGIVEGSTEPLSERCGERFAEGLAEDAARERP